MKMTVLYHTKTGNTKKMADIIAEGMASVDEVEAKAFSIDAIDEDWINESKCVILGTPIYMASICADVKNWLEGPRKQYNLAGKIGGAFATVDYIHGGGELGIQTILAHMLVMGMLVYSGGGAFGKPVIHLGPVAVAGKLEESREVSMLYGQRMAEKTKEILGENRLSFKP